MAVDFNVFHELTDSELYLAEIDLNSLNFDLLTL